MTSYSNVPVVGGNEWQNKQGSRAAVNVATCKTMIKLRFWSLRGVDAVIAVI